VAVERPRMRATDGSGELPVASLRGSRTWHTLLTSSSGDLRKKDQHTAQRRVKRGLTGPTPSGMTIALLDPTSVKPTSYLYPSPSHLSTIFSGSRTLPRPDAVPRRGAAIPGRR
jgi:hypothetical protein